MTKTSVSRQFKKEYPQYKEYADFMDILDPSEKTFLNQSKFVLKPFDEVLRLFNFIFYGKAFPGTIMTDPNFNWIKNTAYFERLFYTFLEWLEEDIFLRENGKGEYDATDFFKWHNLFIKLDKFPEDSSRIDFSVFEDFERKQRENYLKQIKDKLAEKDTMIEKFDLLYTIKMSERFTFSSTLTEWINATLDLLKTGRYEELTNSTNNNISDSLNSTEILLLTHFLSHEELFPRLYKTTISKKRLFLAQLFNISPTSFKNPEDNFQAIINKRLKPGQFKDRIDNLKKINRVLDGISDVKEIENVIKKIKELIYELEVKRNEITKE